MDSVTKKRKRTGRTDKPYNPVHESVDETENGIRVGDTVDHVRFGDGRVLRIYHDRPLAGRSRESVLVEFDPEFGERRIVSTFLRRTKKGPAWEE